MGIIAWIVVGLIAGWLAGLIVRGGGYGLLGNLVVGVVGGLVGGFIAYRFFGMGDPMTGINFPSILIAFLGSVLLLGILRLLGGRRGARG